MPKDLFRQAPLRLVASATVVAAYLCAAPALAQGNAQPPADDRQVQAFFNGIALDQQLAEQYSAPAPQAPVIQTPAAVPPRAVSAQAASLPKSLDEPLDAALDDVVMDQLDAERDSAIVGDEDRTTTLDVPPSPVRTALLVLACLALIAFAGGVLTFAVRELRKDAQHRKQANRRRVKHHDSSTPAHAS